MGSDGFHKKRCELFAVLFLGGYNSRMSDVSDYLTTSQAAELLGVTRRRIVAMIASGRLPVERIGSGKQPVYLIAKGALKLVKDRKAGRPKGSKGKKRKAD